MTSTNPFLGVLMLDTAFPRIAGDAGNAASYQYPIEIARVQDAGSLDVVSANGPSCELTERFVEVARSLEESGAIGLISTCGFLVHRQEEIAGSVSIPVMVSSLSLYPTLKIATGGKPVGIITASSAALLGGTLTAAKIEASEVKVAGMDDCAAFTEAILAEKSAQPDTLDREAIEAYCIETTNRLMQEAPDIGCILLECGNLPPYAAAISEAAQRPVFSILDAARLLWEGSKIESFRF